MPTTVTIQRSDVRSLLFAESTNASRTFTRNDGVSEFDKMESFSNSWKSMILRQHEHELQFHDAMFNEYNKVH